MIDYATVRTNRDYVQRGLTLRAIKQKDEEARYAAIQQEAAQQTAQRIMLEDINFLGKWARVESDTAQALQSRDKQARDRRTARREQQAKRKAQWNAYLKRTFIPVGIAGALNVLHAIGGVSLWLALTGMTLSCLYIIINCAAYTARNNK